MKPCPHCGAMLTTALAEAVANPTRDESCPMADALDRRLKGHIARAAKLLGITEGAEIRAAVTP